MPTIQYMQEHLAKIYPNKDKSPDYMMAHIYTACSDLGRLLLRNERDNRQDAAIISAITWLVALSNHFDLSFQAALVGQFPATCRYCLSKPCRCDRTNKRARNRSGVILSQHEVDEIILDKIGSIKNANETIDFRWVIEQLAEIYPSNRALLAKGGQAFVVGKMLEEGGELHRAYSNYLKGDGGKNDISEELADVMAWVISCWDLDGTGKNLDSEFSSKFIQGCWKCHATPCNCPTYSITKSQEEIIREISRTLRSLSENASLPPVVGEAITKADTASASPTVENKKSLLSSVRSLVRLLGGVDEGSEEISETADHLGDLVDSLQDWV